MTLGEALIAWLEQAGVDTVFGIPGVHTIELYRGLGASKIKHITPRHEQGAAFMADGYARVTGKPGVCLLITGPGFTNAITAMGQARADSIPMLVISGVNATDTLGKGHGHLHELPDQAAMSQTIALWTHTLTDPDALGHVLEKAFAVMTSARPGPVHIEIPTDIMDAQTALPLFRHPALAAKQPLKDSLAEAVALAQSAANPVILAGGGTIAHADALKRLAEALDAPVASTINARGVMHGHPLDVPASPSLESVRELVAKADLAIVLGTELGPTDYDLNGAGGFALPDKTIRVDIDTAQLARGPHCTLAIEADCGAFLDALLPQLAPANRSTGAKRAKTARKAAREEIGPDYRALVDTIQSIWRTLPDATIVGDSTQFTYAGNMMLDAPRPASWFNSATGFGTLGYGPPAAIGAALGTPGKPVVCLVGDGGLQFSLAELGSAHDADADVAFIVHNNSGYGEIETWMVEAGVEPVGVRPSAPDFAAIASAYGLAAEQISAPGQLADVLARLPRPCLIEWID